MKTNRSLFVAALLAAGAAPVLSAAQLQPSTLQAWNNYLDEVNVRLEQRAASRSAFLWTDESDDRAARVRRGEVVVAPLLTHGTQNVPDGLIHHWIGAVFVPGATIETFFSVVHDYEHYKQTYRPAVADSKALPCTQDGHQFEMIFQRHVLFVNAAMQGRYRAHDVMLGSRRGYSVVDADEIRQIDDYGRAGEHMLPPDTGSGFIWRIRSIARFEERNGGVLLEMEAIALTRDIPSSLSWLVTPVVNHLSFNSLTTSLKQTRQAVVNVRARTVTLAKVDGRE